MLMLTAEYIPGIRINYYKISHVRKPMHSLFFSLKHIQTHTNAHARTYTFTETTRQFFYNVQSLNPMSIDRDVQEQRYACIYANAHVRALL